MRTFTRTKKGQSAMEYLMTYGWAILIVIIVAAVLFSLGVFNPSTFQQTAAVGFSGFNVPAGGFQVSSATGTLTMQITNGVGSQITVTESGANIGSTHIMNTGGTTVVGPGQTTTLTFASIGSFTPGAAYTANVNITYTNDNTGLTGFISSGTLSGVAS